MLGLVLMMAGAAVAYMVVTGAWAGAFRGANAAA